jgi:NAD(P)-dependent dehydrogenase (short-subunit alcohol dehydrogenase family)
MGRRLEGKVAVVVGAGSSSPGWSNGKAVAVAYAREGASVVAADFDLRRAEETAKIIVGEGHIGRAMRANATSEEDVEAVMATAAEAFGGIDIVHNNVGMSYAGGSMYLPTVAEWDLEMNQTLKSAFLGCRAAIPYLRSRGGGAIINTSSIAAVRSLNRGSPIAYIVAKAGVEAMTRGYAVEFGPDNIRVNCIRIGYCDTPHVRHGYEEAGIRGEELDKRMAADGLKVPLRGERTTPWEVAAAAVFLASDEASHTTGVVLNVDGGLEIMKI